MQCFSIITISNGQPVIYGPLIIILLVTGIKDIFEDSRRGKSDKEENFKKNEVFDGRTFINTHWKDLKVGDVIKVTYYPIVI